MQIKPPVSSSEFLSQSNEQAEHRSISCEARVLSIDQQDEAHVVPSDIPSETNAYMTTPPWQYRWKRPELYPVVLDESSQLGHLSSLQRKQLAQMTVVDCTSAHLTTNEAQRITHGPQENSNYNGTNQLLQSGDFILVVTILSSQHVTSSENNILADVVLLQIIVCCSSDDGPSSATSTRPVTFFDSLSPSIGSDPSHTSIRLIHSRMMHWPGSMLNNQISNIYERSIHSHTINQQEHISSKMDVRDRTVQSSPSQILPPPIPEPPPFWLSFGRIFSSTMKQLPSYMKPTKRFKGIIKASLCRRPIKTNEQDVDEEKLSNALNALHLMNLGFGPYDETDHQILQNLRKSKQLYTSSHYQSDIPTNQIPPEINQDENNANRCQSSAPTCTTEDDELLLSCLCNNGKLYFFSVMDLFQDEEKNAKTRNQNHDSILESLLLGSHVFSQLNSSIIPLTQPKAIVHLSIAVKNRSTTEVSTPSPSSKDGDGTKSQTHVSEDDSQTSTLDQNTRVSKSKQPFLDLASFDATVEPSSIPYRTQNNRAKLCEIAFDYIVIAGKGTFCPRRLRSSIDAHGDTDSLETNMPSDSGQGSPPLDAQVKPIENINGPPTNALIDATSIDSNFSKLTEPSSNLIGGFVSVISLHHFSEIKNFFLPFDPISIHPVTLQTSRFILIFGSIAHEAVAIPIDTLSELPCVQHTVVDQITPNLFTSGVSNGTTVLRKFSMLDVQFSNSDANMVSLLPVSISSDCHRESSIVCCHKSGYYLCTFGGVSLNSQLERILIFEPKAHFSTFEIDSIPSPPVNSTLQNKIIGDQGWSLMTNKSELHFICWDGASSALGAFHDSFNTLTRSQTSGSYNMISTAKRSSNKLIWTNDDCDGQFIHSYITSSSLLESGSVLTLRKKCSNPANGSSVVDYILDWLLVQGDYSTLSKITLYLLKESLRMGESSHPSFDIFTANSLYDGISICIMNEDKRRYLSNLTIWALVHLGPNVSQMLERFLENSTEYDPLKAGETLLQVLKKNFSSSLWVVPSLLKVGIARRCMVEILDIINCALPDVIRCHPKEMMDTSTTHDDTLFITFQACQALVSMILESTVFSAGILLNMSDPRSGVSYWDSLTQDTRLHLSLVSVGDRRPLLYEPEVREWAISCLKLDIFSAADSSINRGPILPSRWLLDLLCGSFAKSYIEAASVSFNNRPRSTEDLKHYFEDRLRVENMMKQSITVARDRGDFDFDLIIPALLLLIQRNYNCDDRLPHSRLLIEIVCEQAGRLSKNDSPLFFSDIPTLLSQCATLKNASAVACLTGGQDGILLKCIDVLHKFAGLDIETAERYLSEGDQSIIPTTVLPVAAALISSNSWRARAELILILERNVLQLKKFGDLCNHESRGFIDPVLTARFCFRSLCIFGQKDEEENMLAQWLRMRLIPSELGVPNRFSCMAVVRALLWPNDEGTNDDYQLTKALGIEKQFLVDLCRCTIKSGL